MNRILNIVLHEKDNYTFYCVNGKYVFEFENEPREIAFHFGPGPSEISDLTQKVNFLLNKNL